MYCAPLQPLPAVKGTGHLSLSCFPGHMHLKEMRTWAFTPGIETGVFSFLDVQKKVGGKVTENPLVYASLFLNKR